ncbi:MAG: type II secretion system protein GspM [Desulfomonilia bacterium]
MQNLIQTLRQRLEMFSALSRRERLIIGVGALFVGVFILVVFILTPLLDQHEEISTRVALQDQQLRRIYELSEGIRSVQKNAEGAPSVGSQNFSLFGFLEQLAVDLGINDRIEYMKPISDSSDSSRESVEVKIRGLYQEDLIGLLYGIENTPYSLRIKRLNLKRLEREGILDVTFQVVHYG